MGKRSDEQFTPEESKRRMEAALRGARIAGHKSMADIRGEQPKKSKRKSPRKKR